MDTATLDRTETAARDVLVSAVADLRRVPLGELVRARVSSADRGAGGQESAPAVSFNSAV